MLFNKLLPTAAAAGLMALSAQAYALPNVFNDTIANGISQFDSTVVAAGGSVGTAQIVAGTSVYNYTDLNGNPATVTITRPNGSAASFGSAYTSNGITTTGDVININPGIGLDQPGDIPGFGSGVTFTFSSAVNALGFEIGDWATCCTTGTRPADVQSDFGVPATGSGLWIAFDGGNAFLTANALSANDNPGVVAANSFTNFIGAIDDTSTFTSVTFFGDGFGEFLVAGGTLRFSAVPEGSVSNPIPEPGTLVLAGLALVGLGLSRRKQ
ncbi:PEP-CTERM sorting domain-containing protein [Denitromonas iodatirespirans]|uniref:PEP-CTERM sorting domain-containing protein n=1 Tax=Denitromonas iodatirespirans TaxID=2795389 RepID=A0A944DF91_DENI1|nr:PEP-CTERM sorting domain-containing protein [Denitromonas iodatirespirans]MBT0963182.1 PEP-CTERM sorting domain-containing protein [Denitromonas iodatirespirans]